MGMPPAVLFFPYVSTFHRYVTISKSAVFMERGLMLVMWAVVGEDQNWEEFAVSVWHVVREAAVRQDLKSGLQIIFIIGFDVLDEKGSVPANSLLVWRLALEGRASRMTRWSLICRNLTGTSFWSSAMTSHQGDFRSFSKEPTGVLIPSLSLCQPTADL